MIRGKKFIILSSRDVYVAFVSTIKMLVLVARSMSPALHADKLNEKRSYSPLNLAIRSVSPLSNMSTPSTSTSTPGTAQSTGMCLPVNMYLSNCQHLLTSVSVCLPTY